MPVPWILNTSSVLYTSLGVSYALFGWSVAYYSLLLFGSEPDWFTWFLSSSMGIVLGVLNVIIVPVMARVFSWKEIRTIADLDAIRDSNAGRLWYSLYACIAIILIGAVIIYATPASDPVDAKDAEDKAPVGDE